MTSYSCLLCQICYIMLLFIEWNLIGLGGPAYGIVTKTVHKTLPGGARGGQGFQSSQPFLGM